jgi:hypothetical protein
MNVGSIAKWPALAMLLVAVACSDTGLEPTQAPATVAPTAPSASLLGVDVLDGVDTTITRFTIDPTSATLFTVGRTHALYIPAHAVCDLATSSYGPGEWDRPCTPMTAPLVITAKSWKNAQGLPQVDFSPSLRFNPNAGGDVTLYLAVTSHKKLESSPTILYCTTVGAACVDEQLADPSLATHVDRQRGFAYRRIKHFSGYNVSSGRVSDGFLTY